jgi:hypothetical protein
MALRWVISPVVDVVEADPVSAALTPPRAPKVGGLIESGRGKRYQCANAVSSDAFALSLVRAANMAAVDADAEIVNVFEADFSDGQRASLLDTTPRIQGWNTARLTRIRNRLTARGVDTTGLTLDSTLETILDRLVQRWGGARARVLLV